LFVFFEEDMNFIKFSKEFPSAANAKQLQPEIASIRLFVDMGTDL